MPPDEPRLVTPALLRDWPLPEPGSDKNARGQLVVVGGSVDTPGAVRLAGEAGLRSGAGKLVLATAAATTAALAVAVPECQTVSLPATGSGDLSAAADAAAALAEPFAAADAVVVGPGLTDPGQAVRLLARLVPELRGPVVIDALASAFLTEQPDGLSACDDRRVLTVNPGELARTAHRDDDEVAADPAGVAAEVAQRCGVVVLYGGQVKHVVAPDGRSWAVEGGGPGLAVSGSGDVQAGIVGGLLARGAQAEQAAVWGAYLHARAGERCGAGVGAVGYLARELVPEVPRVLAELRDH